MTRLLIHKNEEGRKYPRYSVIEIPEYNNKPKYMKFKNFLENNVVDYTLWPTCDNKDIGALEANENEVYINCQKCIGCLLCLFSQRNLKKLHVGVKEILNKILPVEIIAIIENEGIFNGNIIELPRYSGNKKIKSFNNFTSEKEEKHISLWACAVLNFLSSDQEVRIGKEIEILKMDKPRDGRLDVCVMSGDNVLVCESKVSLDKLLTENRYRVQIPSYQTECERFIGEYNDRFKTEKKLQIYLLIGGEETDLFPPNSPLCTSKTGRAAARFYGDLEKHGIKFISANALWAMVAKSLVNNRRMSWDILFNKIFDNDTIGLLSAGKVVFNNGEYEVQAIPREILRSSEKAFS